MKVGYPQIKKFFKTAIATKLNIKPNAITYNIGVGILKAIENNKGTCYGKFTIVKNNEVFWATITDGVVTNIVKYKDGMLDGMVVNNLAASAGYTSVEKFKKDVIIEMNKIR